MKIDALKNIGNNAIIMGHVNSQTNGHGTPNLVVSYISTEENDKLNYATQNQSNQTLKSGILSIQKGAFILIDNEYIYASNTPQSIQKLFNLNKEINVANQTLEKIGRSIVQTSSNFFFKYLLTELRKENDKNYQLFGIKKITDKELHKFRFGCIDTTEHFNLSNNWEYKRQDNIAHIISTNEEYYSSELSVIKFIPGMNASDITSAISNQMLQYDNLHIGTIVIPKQGNIDQAVYNSEK